MSRRQADMKNGIPQCMAYFEYPEGRIGAYGCFRFPCCLEYGHDGNDHHNDLEAWPGPFKVAVEGFKVFDPRKHEHYCQNPRCGDLFTCNEMICERPVLCEKCKEAHGHTNMAASV
jgi:hypothetical protein